MLAWSSAPVIYIQVWQLKNVPRPIRLTPRLAMELCFGSQAYESFPPELIYPDNELTEQAQVRMEINLFLRT